MKLILVPGIAAAKVKLPPHGKYLVEGGIQLIQIWLESEYSRACEMMLKATDTKHAPWNILRSDDKKRARHILDLIPYKKVPREKIRLPDRSMKHAYDDAASLKGRKFVPEKY